LYFFVQTLGSLLIICGFVFAERNVSLVGILIKLGIFPFFIWVPQVLNSLKWFGFFILLVVKKVPLFFLICTIFRQKTFWIFLVSAIFGVFGMFFSQKNLKIFLCWSSVVKRSFKCLLFLINPILGGIFFILYFFLMLIICLLKFSKKIDLFFSNISSKKNFIQIWKFFLLMFSSFPIFFAFFQKTILIRSLGSLIFFKDMIEDFEFFSKRFFFVIFLRIIILLQTCAYIKYFKKKNFLCFK